MIWVPPQPVVRHTSRTAYGFDPQGHFVSDVDGHALRAILDAMQQTLRENFKAAQWSDREIKTACQQAVRMWLQCLSQTNPEGDIFTEAWIKGTMHLYSSEFYFLADSYARQICEDEETYLRHLVASILPNSLREAGKSLSLQQVYSSTKGLFQHTMPLDVRVVKSGRRSATLQWYATAALARVSPSYRTALIHSMSRLIRTMFEQLPVLLKGQPAAHVKEREVEEEVIEWHVKWREPFGVPRYALGGGAVSLLVLGITLLTDIPFLAYFDIIPLLLGIGWEVYSYQQRKLSHQQKMLLDQIEYNYLQSLELSTVYANLRNANIAHEKQVRDLLAVREAVLELSSSFDQRKVLDGMVGLMTELLRFDRALVLLHDREKKALTYGILSHPLNEPADQMRLMNLMLELDANNPTDRADPLIGQWLEGKSIRVQEPAIYYNSRLNWVLALLEFNDFYSVPLRVGDQLLGVLLVDNHFTRVPISIENRSLVDALVTSIAITMENARLYHLQDIQLQKIVNELRILEQIDRELVNTLKLSNVLELVLDWGLRFTGADIATLALVDEAQGTGQIVGFLGCQAEQLPGGEANLPLSLEQIGIGGRAARLGKTQVVSDVSADPDYVPIQTTIKSQISAPISRRGKVIAVITLQSRHPNHFTPEHVAFTERLSARAGVGLENARLFTEAHQERDKLSAILTNTTDAVIVVNDAGSIVLLNHAACHVFRLKQAAESYVGQPFQTVFATSPLVEIYERLRSETKLRPDTEITLEDRTYHVNAAQVEAIGYTLILHDVTPFKDLDRLKNELVSSVSHDLKNPLSVMRGYVDLIEMTQPLTEKGHTYKEKITESIQGMQDLIDNLLDLAKIDSGITLEYTPLNLPNLIQQVQEKVALHAQQKGITLVNHFDPNLLLAYGDETRVKQIVNNLIGNAIKYTLDAAEVITSVTQEAHFIKVSIQDHGIGIPEEALPTIWDRFVRVRDEQTKHIEGTGLGLAIVKSLVEAHGGQVGVKSQVNAGSTFWFTLPCATPEQIVDSFQMADKTD